MMNQLCADCRGSTTGLCSEHERQLAQPPPALPALPLIAPTRLMPGPVSTEISVGTAMVGGKAVVALQVVTPTGAQIFFLEPAGARQIGAHLQATAAAAGSGLVIAPSALKE